METHKLTASIRREHQLIEENQRERNEKFQRCITNFTQHLQNEIELVQKSLASNEQRNNLINEGFETAYNRMLTGAEQIIRRMTNTYSQKRDFWKKVIEAHPEITSLDTKSTCYEKYSQTQEKYYEAIECQKVAKVPYRVILCDREENNGLEIEQQKNKQLEAHVAITRKDSQKSWGTASQTKPNNVQRQKQDSMLSDQVIGKFVKTTNNAPNIPKPPPVAPRPGSSRSRAERDDSQSLLNEFLKR